jgi:hypothetical protein
MTTPIHSFALVVKTCAEENESTARDALLSEGLTSQCIELMLFPHIGLVSPSCTIPPAGPDKPSTRTNKHFSSNTRPFLEIFGFT